MKKPWIVIAFLFVAPLLAVDARAQSQPLVLEGGTLIDGTGRAAIPDAVIVMEGSRIKAIGTKGKVSYPPNAKVIPAEGKTILPGLIDGHIHFTAWMPPLFLYFGVTTVFDTANPTEWIIAQRDAIRKGRMKGPRIFVTGVAIDGPAERSNPNHPAELGGYKVHVRTPEEARATVREIAGAGVDAIKVHEGLTPELLKAVVDEARNHGLEVVGHSHNARDAANAGLKFIEHTWPITNATITDPATLKEIDEKNLSSPDYMMETAQFDSLAALLLKNGMFFNPTIAISKYWRTSGPHAKEWADYLAKFSQDPALRFVPQVERQAWLGTMKARGTVDPGDMEQTVLGFKKAMEVIRKYAAAGGRFVAGPDLGGGDHGLVAGLALHFEMQSLVDAGLTPMQAILSATKWPAELFHKEKDLGTLEVGKIADAILVDGDPLADIRTTRNVRLVIQDGQIVDTTLDPQFRNPLPRTVYVQAVTGSQGPAISAITPKVAREGDPDFPLQVLGNNFTQQSVVRFDTTDLKTQFVDGSKLTAVVPSALLKKFGTYAVTVVNPGSGGGTSIPAYFLVNFRDP